MRDTSGFFCTLITILLLTSCSKDENTPPNLQSSDPESINPVSLLNVSYGTDEAQTYDLYLPAQRSEDHTKILVFIHGGGWIQGDKKDMRDYIPLLQASHPAHAIANLNYRLAQPPQRAAFPNQFLDLKLALEHISMEAEDLGIKAEFGLIGVSAGGHLALQYDNLYDPLDQVKLVCSIVGPTNFKDPYYTENKDFDEALELLVDESKYPGVTDYARAVSPAYLVDENSSATILFYGDEDPLVPVSNGTFLQEQLDAAGVSNSFTLYKGGHGDWEDSDHENLQLELSSFIDHHLPLD